MKIKALKQEKNGTGDFYTNERQKNRSFNFMRIEFPILCQLYKTPPVPMAVNLIRLKGLKYERFFYSFSQN